MKCASLLLNLWQEFDHYLVFEMKCIDDATILKNFIKKDQIQDISTELNPEFDQVRIQIIGKKNIPTLEETISLIHAEES